MIDRFYTNNVEIYSLVPIAGSKKQEYTKRYTTKGNLQSLTSNEVFDYDTRSLLANYRLFISKDFTVNNSDELVIDGKKYSVYQVDNTLFNAKHQEILLRNKI